MVDDGEYFVPARALRDGESYTLPSRPGNPAAWRPPGLSLIVAAALKLFSRQGTLASDFAVARAVLGFCGALFSLAAYFWLRRMGVGQILAAAIVCVAMFHPTTLEFSTAVMSDVPFAALCSLLFLRWGSPARSPGNAPARAGLVDGLLAGAAWLVRGNGITLVLASIAAALCSRRRVAALGACVAGTGAVVALSWAFTQQVGLPGDSGFYAGQLGVRESIAGVFVTASRNLEGIPRVLTYVVAPVARTNTISHRALVVVILQAACGVSMLVGLLVVFSEWKMRALPILVHTFLTFLVFLIPPWGLEDRYFLPLYPLLALAFFVGVREIAKQVTRAFQLPRAWVLPAVAALCGVNVLLMGGLRARATWSGAAPAFGSLDATFSYIRQELPPDAIIASFWPEMTFLYTGREGVELIPLADLSRQRWGRWALLESTMGNFPNRPFYLLADLAFDAQAQQMEALLQDARLRYRARNLFRTADGRWWLLQLGSGRST